MPGHPLTLPKSFSKNILYRSCWKCNWVRGKEWGGGEEEIRLSGCRSYCDTVSGYNTIFIKLSIKFHVLGTLKWVGGEGGILLIILLYFGSTELVPTECIMLLSIFLLVQLRHPSYFWQTPVAAVEGHSHKLAEELGLYPRQTGHSGNTSGGDPVKRTR